jgi:hypothetical protein
MANTWRALAQAVLPGIGKSMIDVLNGNGATRVLRVRRAYVIPTTLGVTSATFTQIEVRRSTYAQAGSLITPVAYDNRNSQLEKAVTSGTNRTVTDGGLFRRYLCTASEVTQGTSTIDEWETLVPFSEVWNAGYADANVQPVVCRANEGFHLKSLTANNSIPGDYEIEFTDEAA